jgi:hypothetical protein
VSEWNWFDATHADANADTDADTDADHSCTPAWFRAMYCKPK